MAVYPTNGTRMSNQEKSAARYASLTALAEQFAKEDKAFKDFLLGKEPTWRRMETYLKRQFEAGAKIQIIIVDTSGV